MPKGKKPSVFEDDINDDFLNPSMAGIEPVEFTGKSADHRSDNGPGLGASNREHVGHGDQTLVHVAGSNTSTVAYDGGKGNDTFNLHITSDLYDNEAVRNELLAFEEFLANTVDHDSSGLHGEVFTFTTLNITVQNVEDLVVTVDGTDVVVEPYVEPEPEPELPSFFTEFNDEIDFNLLVDPEDVAALNSNDGMHDALDGDDVVHLPDTYAEAAAIGYDTSIIFNGGAGNDTIYGGDDVKSLITGGTGDDFIHGGYGTATNRLYGGDGNDSITGGRGKDFIYGEDGDDHLQGGQKLGSDTLYGGNGNDELEGHGGNDFLYGGADDDLLRGSTGNDLLDGGTGNDLLYGNEDSDILNGGDGDDLLWGGHQNDILDGGAGNDRVWGEKGNDTLIFKFGESDGADRYDGGVYGNDVFRVDFGSEAELEAALTDLQTLQTSIDAGYAFGEAVPAGVSWGNQDNVYLETLGVYVNQMEELQTTVNGVDTDWGLF